MSERTPGTRVKNDMSPPGSPARAPMIPIEMVIRDLRAHGVKRAVQNRLRFLDSLVPTVERSGIEIVGETDIPSHGSTKVHGADMLASGLKLASGFLEEGEGVRFIPELVFRRKVGENLRVRASTQPLHTGEAIFFGNIKSTHDRSVYFTAEKNGVPLRPQNPSDSLMGPFELFGIQQLRGNRDEQGIGPFTEELMDAEGFFKPAHYVTSLFTIISFASSASSTVVQSSVLAASVRDWSLPSMSRLLEPGVRARSALEAEGRTSSGWRKLDFTTSLHSGPSGQIGRTKIRLVELSPEQRAEFES